jgi:DNA-binding NtrC family response regulator
MQLYSWPGNVRELENLIERMVILNRTGVIGFDDLPTGVRSPSADFAVATANMPSTEAIDLVATLARIEAALIDRAMRTSGGNKTRAADLLGLSRTTLLDKLKRASGESGN